MLKRIVVLVLFCFIIINNVHSQVEKIVVDDIEMAYLSFDDKEDSSAFEYFTTRQKKYPKDPVYNYYAGACYLFVKDKPEKAVDYLRFASTQNVPSDVFFFLAKAYHLNYEFDNAIKYYNRFKYNATRKQIKKYDLLNNIRKAENGKYLIQNVFLHELISVENKNIKSLYRNYNSKYVSGEFLLVNDFVENESIDSNNLSVIYKGKNIKENEVFYFSMPNKKDGDKDIFSLVRINDTTWSKPQNLGDIINTDFDEEYPYIHTDGTTLFFASKGHYSMGGYDIYKSTWNWDENKWTEPISLDFPINSVNNDYLYIPYDNNLKAVFSSDRNCSKDSINIYNLLLSQETANINLIDDFKEYVNLNSKINKTEESNKKQTGDGIYDNSIQNSIKYQLKADSLNWLIDDYKLKLKQVVGKKQKLEYKNIIAKLNNEAIKYQKIADENYSKSRSYEIENLNYHNTVDEEINEKNNPNRTFEKKRKLKIENNSLHENVNYSILGLEFKDNFYSKSNPIPINKEIQNGVVYMIQLGAYSKNVKPEIFKALYPCVGYTKPNSNITRYFAGEFSLFDNALEALPKVKSTGFKDAFIVAFENNKRVSVASAKKNESKYIISDSKIDDINDNKKQNQQIYFEIHLDISKDEIESFEKLDDSLLKSLEIRRNKKLDNYSIVISRFSKYKDADIIKKKLKANSFTDAEIHAFFIK